MRHGKKFNHLSRKTGHRRALMRNLSIALITHKRIRTTLAKAKALRRHIEPIITKAKTNDSHQHRVVFGYLQNKEATNELFEVVGPAVGDRPGGYTRVLRTGFRKGDGAEMAMIELVDFNELYTAPKSKGSAKTTRRRRRRGSGSTKAAAPVTATAVREEE